MKKLKMNTQGHQNLVRNDEFKACCKDFIPCSFCDKEWLYTESIPEGLIYYCKDHVNRSKFYGGLQNKNSN